MAFVKICMAAQISPGRMDSFYVEGQEVLILRDKTGALHALEGMCPHEDYPLVAGTYDGATLSCAAHGWIFNASTGRGINPSNCRLASYPVKTEGEEIHADLDATQD